MNNCCGNCIHHTHEECENWICDNERSRYFADYTPFKHTCEDFEERKGARDYEWPTTDDRK